MTGRRISRAFGLPPLVAAFSLAVAPAFAGNAEQDIRAVLEAQTAAWNRGDIPAFMEGYLQTDALRFVSGNAVRHGFEATLERYLATYDTRARMGTLAFRDLDIEVLGDDAAVVFGRFELTRPEEGDATGLFTLVFRRIDGAWVIVHDHTSS